MIAFVHIASYSLYSSFMYIYLLSHLYYSQKLKPQAKCFVLFLTKTPCNKTVCQKLVVIQPISIFCFFLTNRIPIFSGALTTIFSASFTATNEHVTNIFLMRYKHKLLGETSRKNPLKGTLLAKTSCFAFILLPAWNTDVLTGVLAVTQYISET